MKIYAKVETSYQALTKTLVNLKGKLLRIAYYISENNGINQKLPGKIGCFV